jgi:hypothetical protein
MASHHQPPIPGARATVATDFTIADIPDIAVGDKNAAARQAAYNDELVSRFQNGLPLTNADRKAARRVLRERAEQSA